MELVCTAIGNAKTSVALVPAPPRTAVAPPRGHLLIRTRAAGLAFPDILAVEGKHINKREVPFAC